MNFKIVNHLRHLYHQCERILAYPGNIIYKKILNVKVANGIILLAHESENLGASLLLKNIAKEIKENTDINIYIISRYFGPLNDEFYTLGPLTIVQTKAGFRRVIKKLKKLGYQKLISNCSINGAYIEIAEKSGIETLCLMNELPSVIRVLGMEKECKKTFVYAQNCVFPTHASVLELQEYICAKCHGNVHVMPQGIYNKRLPEELEKNALLKMQEKVSRQKYRYMIIGVGNAIKIKGVDRFIEMAAESDQSILYVWAGSKSRFYEEYTKDKKMPQNYLYIGLLPYEELSGLYQCADLLFLSSRVDTFPSVMLEAMQYGVPVAGFSESGGISDVVVDNDNGLLVKDWTQKDELLIKVNSLLMDKDKLMVMRKNAELTAKKYNFTNYTRFLCKVLGYGEIE